MHRIAGFASRLRAVLSSASGSSRRRAHVARTPVEPMERRVLMTGTLPAWVQGEATWDDVTDALVVTGPATITANPGADAPRITVGEGGALSIDPTTGLAVHVATLTLDDGGSATLAPSGGGNAAQRVLVIDGVNGVAGLDIADDPGAGTLDINDNALIVRFASQTTIGNYVARGFNNGDWLGTGVTSSAAANNGPAFMTGVGTVDNAELGATDFGGVPGLTGGEILVRYTYYGDADLSGTVTLDDYSQLLLGLENTLPAHWSVGDFDYSGTVTLDDYSAFLLAYQNAGVSNVTATPLDGTGVHIDWDDAPVGPVTYSVYRGTTHDFTPGSPTLICSGLTLSEWNDFDPGLNTSTGYFYKVVAINESGATTTHVPANGGGPGSAAVTAPPAPTGMSTTGEAWIDGVNLTWQGSSGATGYVIEWSKGGEWIAIDEVNGTSYTDEYPTFGNQEYRVVATRLDPPTSGSGGGLVWSSPSSPTAVDPKAPPVAWFDDNAGPNDRGTLSGFSVPHNSTTGIAISVLPGDADYDLDAYSIPAGGYTQPANGTVTLDPSGTSFTYKPNGAFVGIDTFEYWVVDAEGVESENATVAIDVTNTIPRVHSTTYSYPGNPPEYNPPYSYYSHTVEHNGVTYHNAKQGNFGGSDEDGDALTYRVVDIPEHGKLHFNATTGEFLYGTNPDFNGIDRFTVVANDGIADSLPATITIASHVKLELRSTTGATRAGGWMTQGFLADSLQLIHPPQHMQYGFYSEFADPETDPPLAPNGPLSQDDSFWVRFPDSYVGNDTFGLSREWGNVVPPPMYRSWRFLAPGDAEPGSLYVQDHRTYFPVPAEAGPVTFTPSDTGFKRFSTTVLTQGIAPIHGELSFDEVDGSFTYTPATLENGEPYLGWDFFSYTRQEAGYAPVTQWIQLDVIASGSVAAPTVNPLPFLEAASSGGVQGSGASSSAPSRDDLLNGVEGAKNTLKLLLTSLATLGRGVEEVKNAPDLQILAKLDAATGLGEEPTGTINAIAQQYDQYVLQLVELNKAAGVFLADQWYVSQADYDAVMAVNALPTKVGSLSMSKKQMDDLAGSLDAMGDGAGIAVSNAGTLVKRAEQTHKVLTAVEMAGGVTALVRTGATLLVKEGLKACAKAAAKEIMQETASGLAAELANHAAVLAGVSEEHRQYIAIGVDAYQSFAFFKAARIKLDPNGNCFVAGTQVIMGTAADGSFITKSIEDIAVGDVVLSKDQYDAGDDLDPRRVVNVFRKTSDHVRVLTFRDGNGNVETISTTDEHPFYVGGAGWTEADDLQPGVRVSEADGTDVVLIGSVRESYPQGVTVFNLEVDGDHTYYVEDGRGGQSPVWAHNMCVGDTFVARGPHGKVSKFDSATEVTWTRATSQQKQIIDDEYNGVIRDANGDFLDIDLWNSGKSKFLRNLSHDEAAVAQLRAAGFSQSDIKAMKGVEIGENQKNWIPPKLPSNWEVHHKTPREAGGGNDFGNLVIIRREQHRVLSNEERLLFGDVEPTENKTFVFPMFEGKLIHDNW